MYLKCDVLWLTDVFEKFKNSSLKNYGRCQSHYLSAPPLSWDAMLSMKKVDLEFSSDAVMCLFFKKGMRGRICYISKRYSKTKNNYLKFHYPEQESEHVIYLNASDLYVSAMSKFLLTDGFKWINLKEFYSNKYSNNSSKGCVLEVDVEYPNELRQLRNDYSLAPDKKEIKK